MEKKEEDRERRRMRERTRGRDKVWKRRKERGNEKIGGKYGKST